MMVGSVGTIRSPNYTITEKKGLVDLIAKYSVLLCATPTGNKIARNEKNLAWQHVVQEFNSSGMAQVARSEHQLRKLWKNLKVQSKKHETQPGTGKGLTELEPSESNMLYAHIKRLLSSREGYVINGCDDDSETGLTEPTLVCVMQTNATFNNTKSDTSAHLPVTEIEDYFKSRISEVESAPQTELSSLSDAHAPDASTSSTSGVAASASTSSDSVGAISQSYPVQPDRKLTYEELKVAVLHAELEERKLRKRLLEKDLEMRVMEKQMKTVEHTLKVEHYKKASEMLDSIYREFTFSASGT